MSNDSSAELRIFVALAKALADNVELVARDSFATTHETFELDFEAEDPAGFRAWKSLSDAIKATGFYK
jgi:hypothetical protein